MTQQRQRKTWSAWMPLCLGFLSLAVLIGVLGVWGVKARIAGAVVASGMVQVESNRQVIQHPQGGVVGAIFAKDGDAVKAGDIVLRFDGALLKSELAIIEGQLFEIFARKTRLEAERDGLDHLSITPKLQKLSDEQDQIADLIEGQNRLFKARAASQVKEAEQLDEQITQVTNQIAGSQAQLSALKIQEKLIRNELVAGNTLLKKGLIQASRVSALERERARLLGDIGNLNAQVAQLKGQIAAFNIEKLKLVTVRREEAIGTLRDLQVREIELSERRLSTKETLSRMDVRSPVNGVIYNSQVFALQSVITAANPIMYVIPQDQPLIVSARVETIHIDQVHLGQAVSLRFTAFDQRMMPEIFGQLAKLSADAFTEEATGLTYYRVELQINDGELDKLGNQKLIPGMPVEAYIKTAERSPLSYLTKPLMDYFNKAFREN